MDDWNMINAKQAAEILGVKVGTIHTWMFNKKIPFPYYKISTRVIRFKRTEVLAYLESIRK